MAVLGPGSGGVDCVVTRHLSMDSLLELVDDYIDHHGVNVVIRDGPPTSSLDFLRIVRANRPVVFKNATASMPKLKQWATDDYLVRKVGKQTLIKVALTMDGLADSVSSRNGSQYFVEPLYQNFEFGHVLDSMNTSDRVHIGGETPRTKPVYYVQAQNSNMDVDFDMLKADLLSPVWATEGLGEPPVATNLWIGDCQSVTSLHADPFENLYLTVTGTKLFVLFPPHELICMHEQKFPCAQLNEKFEPVPKGDSDPNMVPWIPIPTAPLLPEETCETFSTCPMEDLLPESILKKFPLVRRAHPHRIVLRPGDMLYLPALWVHGVGQTGHTDENPKCIAVNWWYDMDYSCGGVWSLHRLVRKLLYAYV